MLCFVNKRYWGHAKKMFQKKPDYFTLKDATITTFHTNELEALDNNLHRYYSYLAELPSQVNEHNSWGFFLLILPHTPPHLY